MSSTPTLPGRKVFWYFAAFFWFISLVNAVMISYAVRTHTGLVTEHPYEKGLAYNQVIEAARAQEKLGWRGNVALTGSTLRFTLRDRAGRILTPTAATAYITRPTSKGHDFSIPLQKGAAEISFPEPGVWDVRVEAEANGKPYQHNQRLVVP